MKPLLTVCVLLSLLGGMAMQVGSAEDAIAWKPAATPLLTEWGKQVTPDNAWREYPRPLLVRSEWQNLNGLWEYAVTAKDAPQPTAWSGRILVPFAIESALSGVGRLLDPGEALWYHRRVTLSAAKAGHRAILHFEGVDWDATAFVNGRQVASHRGMNEPWQVDITDVLSGNEVELVVKVVDPTEGGQPRGKQSLKPSGCFYTRVSGIWQTVWLEQVPQRHITNVLAEQIPTADGVDLTVSTSVPGLPISVTMSLAGRTVLRTTATSGTKTRLAVDHPRRWTPSSPTLYDLELSIDGGETVSSYTALRWCEVKADAVGINRLFLNGVPLFQYGPLDQGWWPDGLLTPPSDAAMRSDLEFLKKAGFNMLRKHIKVESRRYYAACDQLGLMVWQDFPCGGGMEKTPETRANFRREIQGILDHLRGFPCIVTWVVFNERWGQFDEAGTRQTVAWTKSYDPTRIVSGASGWLDYPGLGEVIDVHRYPGPAMPYLDAKRVAILGEFGGQGLAVKDHMWDAKSWGYKSSEDPEALATQYQRFMTDLRPLMARGLSAAVYTQTSDVEIEKNGLLTYDRAVTKIPVERLAAMHAGLYAPLPRVRTIAPTSELTPVLWRITTNAPAGDWMTPAFADRGWISAAGGFGQQISKYTANTMVVRTAWTTDDLWARRPFTHDGSDLANPALVIYADKTIDLWIDGKPCIETQVRANAGSYTIVPVPGLVLSAGEHTIALHAQREKRKAAGDQYCDVGLIDLGR